MRIPSGTTDQFIYFVAVDSTDFTTRETGLSGFTVYRSRDGAAATAMTTPTINETSSANMPGVYELLLDEDMTIASGNDSEEMVFHITHASMAPVTRAIELYRPKITLGSTSTAQTGDAFARLGAPAGASVSADIAAIEAQTDDIGTAGAGLTAVPWNAAWDAEVQSEVNDGLVALGLDHLVSASVTGTDVADNSIIAQIVDNAATSDWDNYDKTAESLSAIRARGDAAWTTGGGGSISDILSWTPLIPTAIDLANTKSWRFGIALTNMLDDLPTTTEITPGTISIDRAAQGGTSWTSVVADAACSEIAGLIYYDEVFDTATGYAAGDVLRITFKDALVTVSANDYELYGATGRVFYTGIIADTPDVNIAAINGSATNVAAMDLFFSAVNPGTGQLDSGSFAANTITATAIQDGAFTSPKFADNYLTAAKVATGAIDADAIATDAVTEIQSGLATSAALATVDSNVDAILVDTGTTLPGLIGTPAGADVSTDIAAVKAQTAAIETDTQDIQGRLPATLNNGSISADVQRINDVAVVGDGSGTPFTV